jgi:hypothetical protein
MRVMAMAMRFANAQGRRAQGDVNIYTVVDYCSPYYMMACPL